MEEKLKIRKYLYKKLKNDLESKNPFMEYTLSFLKWQDEYGLFDRENLEDLILKIAIWYEFKYPRRVIYNLYNDLGNVDITLPINKEILDSLSYDELELIKTVFNLNNFSDVFQFDNLDTILDDVYLKKPRFKSQINLPDIKCFVDVTAIGLIKYDYCFDKLKEKLKVIDDSYIGKHISELKPLLSDIDCKAIDDAIFDYNNQVYFHNGLLTCVLYKILERGLMKHDYGIERALLFAKEFDLDTSIPLKFGSSSNKTVESYLSRNYNLKDRKSFNKEDLQEKLILLLKERLYQEEKKMLKK